MEFNLKEIIGNPDRFQYEELYEDEDYRAVCSSEDISTIFFDTCAIEPGESLVEWGCGTGRGSLRAWLQGLDVTMIDFASNCLDANVDSALCDNLSFLEHDALEEIDIRTDYALCCDFIEHFDEKQIDTVMANVLKNSTEVFFRIHTNEDKEGLRKTVNPYGWWLKKFADLNVIVIHSNEFQGFCLFHVSGHRNFWYTRAGPNVEQEKIHEQIRENAKWGVQQLAPKAKGEAELRPGMEDPPVVMIVGGPSLNDYVDEIKAKRAMGYPLITVNNTFNWALDHGMEPSMQFMIDAREFNNRFVERHDEAPHCKFAIASQCHPSVFEMLPEDRTYMWQVSLEDSDIEVVNEAYGTMYEDWFPIPGGCSVTLRALCALQTIGFRKVIIYGFDSCLREGEHHAYEQPENDTEFVLDVRVGKGTKNERRFKCHTFMAIQAKEFMKLTEVYFQKLDLDVKGDGLIAHLIKTGAEM